MGRARRFQLFAHEKPGGKGGAMRKPELSALTGIRFYAALLVFLSHAPLIPGMGPLEGRYLLFNAGVVGVSFFFVLSGFILTYNYADIFHQALRIGDYKRFVWDRLTKIYPVHFAVTLLMIPMQVFSPNLPLDWRAVPVHLLLLQCFWPKPEPRFGSYLNVPSWSISCEWFFYLLAPLLILCVFGRLRRFAPALVLALYVSAMGWFLSGSSEFDRLYYVSWFAPSRVPEFLCGVVLATLYLGSPRTCGAVAASFLEGLGIALIFLGAVYRDHAPWPFWGGLLYLPGSALLVYGLAQNRGVFASHLSHRWLNVLGTASFSFYLIHAPLLRGLRFLWSHFAWQVTSWPGLLATVLVVYLAVQVLAIACCYGYEIPVQKWLRRLLAAPQTPSAGPEIRQSRPLRARAASSST
jgi:peptidoglycan/LPS O-acetylase OafA/YrhL